jgi:hypothetical protein
LIYEKSEYAKVLILGWAIISFIAGNGAGIVSGLMQDFDDGFETFTFDKYITDIIFFAVGVLILDFTRRTVVVSAVS